MPTDLNPSSSLSQKYLITGGAQIKQTTPASQMEVEDEIESPSSQPVTPSLEDHAITTTAPAPCLEKPAATTTDNAPNLEVANMPDSGEEEKEDRGHTVNFFVLSLRKFPPRLFTTELEFSFQVSASCAFKAKLRRLKRYSLDDEILSFCQ